MKIRNGTIINKFRKSQHISNKEDKYEDKYEEIKLEIYKKLKADLCSTDDVSGMIHSWFFLSFSIIGFIVFLDVFFSFFSGRTEFNIDFSTMPYVIASILILVASDFFMCYLNSKITKSDLSLDEKINRLNNNILVSGFNLRLIRFMIVGFVVLLLFSFYSYFDPEIQHPFGNSFIIYLLLITLINIVKKNVSFFYHILFGIISFILYIFNQVAFGDLSYAEDYNNDDTYQTQAVDLD